MTPVAVHNVDEWADRVQWHLNEFCASGENTPDKLMQEIRDTERQMWLVEDDGIKCVVLTNVSTDLLKTCQVTHCAGEDVASWVHLWEVIEAWAKDIGCQRIVATTRPGWRKPLAQFGMKQTHILLEKRI